MSGYAEFVIPTDSTCCFLKFEDEYPIGLKKWNVLTEQQWTACLRRLNNSYANNACNVASWLCCPLMPCCPCIVVPTMAFAATRNIKRLNKAILKENRLLDAEDKPIPVEFTLFSRANQHNLVLKVGAYGDVYIGGQLVINHNTTVIQGDNNSVTGATNHTSSTRVTQVAVAPAPATTSQSVQNGIALYSLPSHRHPPAWQKTCRRLTRVQRLRDIQFMQSRLHTSQAILWRERVYVMETKNEADTAGVLTC